MTYKETLDFIFNLHRFGIKPGLGNIRRFCKYLGNPQDSFDSIHIAGTNGKGSVAAITQSIICEIMPEVGLFTSPHLISFRERIRIGREKLIPVEYIVDFFSEHKDYIMDNGISFFESVTALAFCYFNDMGVNLAIIETGLGGKYDATNILKPMISVITPIGYDHTKYLGDDLISIAEQKAGIIQKDIPVVISKQDIEIINFFNSYCKNISSKLYYYNELADVSLKKYINSISFILLNINNIGSFTSNFTLIGEYQLSNLITALSVISVLNNDVIHVIRDNIQQGLSKLYWPGRFEILDDLPGFIFDVAHNPMGINKLFNTVNILYKNKKVIPLLGLAKDKDHEGIFEVLKSEVDKIITVTPYNPRVLPAKELAEIAKDYGLEAVVIPEIRNALSYTLELKKCEDCMILVTGSHYTVGEAIYKLHKMGLIESRLVKMLGYGFESELGIGVGF